MSDVPNPENPPNDGEDPFAYVPETFRTEDGKPDPTAFRARFDELEAARAMQAEAEAAFPEKPEDYPFQAPDDLSELFPEGFEPPEDFKLELADDPDLPALKAMLHEHKVPAEVASGLAKMLATREIRAVHQARQDHRAEMQKLGPTARSRIDTVNRFLAAKLPKAEAEALDANLFTADAIRALEKLLPSGSVRPSTSGGSGVDLSTMKPGDKIAYGLQMRRKG